MAFDRPIDGVEAAVAPAGTGRQRNPRSAIDWLRRLLHRGRVWLPEPKLKSTWRSPALPPHKNPYGTPVNPPLPDFSPGLRRWMAHDSRTSGSPCSSSVLLFGRPSNGCNVC